MILVLTRDAALESTIRVSVPYIRLEYRERAKEIRKAIEVAMRMTVRAAEKWKYPNFPERTGALIGSSTVGVFFEPDASGLKRKFVIRLTSGNARVPYASYVNKMRAGTNWTNPLTKLHYFDQWVRFVKEKLIEYLNIYVRPLTRMR